MPTPSVAEVRAYVRDQVARSSLNAVAKQVRVPHTVILRFVNTEKPSSPQGRTWRALVEYTEQRGASRPTPAAGDLPVLVDYERELVDGARSYTRRLLAAVTAMVPTAEPAELPKIREAVKTLQADAAPSAQKRQQGRKK